MIYGYASVLGEDGVPTPEGAESIERQVRILEAEGIPSERISTEVQPYPSASDDEPSSWGALDALLLKMAPGDTLCVVEWYRIRRSQSLYAMFKDNVRAMGLDIVALYGEPWDAMFKE